MGDLYTLNYQYSNFEKTLNEMVEAGEIDEECVRNTLADIRGDLESKCVEICKSIKNREAQIAGIDQRTAEIKERLDRIGNHKKKIQKSVDYLKALVNESLDLLDYPVIDTADFIVRKVGKKASVEVTDINSVHSDFIVEKVSYSIDKAKAYECLSNGGQIDGLKLGSDKRLEIK